MEEVEIGKYFDEATHVIHQQLFQSMPSKQQYRHLTVDYNANSFDAGEKEDELAAVAAGEKMLITEMEFEDRPMALICNNKDGQFRRVSRATGNSLQHNSQGSASLVMFDALRVDNNGGAFGGTSHL